MNKAGTSRQPPPPEPPLHTRHHCYPRTTPPRRNTTSQRRRRPTRGPRSSPLSRGQEEEEGNLTEASKEGIGAKGVDFAVAAALAKGLPRFQLTTSNSQPPEPKDNTKRDAGHRNQKGIEQIGQDEAGLLHKTPMRSARRPPRCDPRPLPPCYPRSQEDSHPAPTGATCRGIHAGHTIRGRCPGALGPPRDAEQPDPRRHHHR